MISKMKKIGVFSGKGGVGKTTITASLAIIFKEKGTKILAVDTDVDAPNLSILFETNSKPKAQLTVKTTEKASLLPKKCTHCRKCVDEKFCHFNAIKWDSTNNIP